MTAPVLEVQDIKDGYTQEMFKRLRNFFNADAVTKCDFQFIEINFPVAMTDYKYPHSLGYQPLDVVLLHNFSNATVSFNYAKFTDKHIYVTSNASTVLRLLIGRYK